MSRPVVMVTGSNRNTGLGIIRAFGRAGYDLASRLIGPARCRPMPPWGGTAAPHKGVAGGKPLGAGTEEPTVWQESGLGSMGPF